MATVLRETHPEFIAFMKAELVAFVKFIKRMKKDLHPQLRQTTDLLPSLQKLNEMDGNGLERLYRESEQAILSCRTNLKMLIEQNPATVDVLPSWVGRWLRAQPPHGFVFANNYNFKPVEAMRAELIECRQSFDRFGLILPGFIPSEEQLRSANPDEVRKFCNYFGLGFIPDPSA